MQDEPVHRGIFGIDIERFARAEWTDPLQARLRGRLHRMVDQALAYAQIDPALTTRSDTGDGMWLLIEPQISIARLLHPLATRLANGLAAHNHQVPPTERLRLRLVVHAGNLLRDPYGYTGASFNHAARLLDAEATRALLAAHPTADAVVVASDVVYQGVVRHGYEGIDPAAWQPVRIHAKETSTRAWAYVPGLASQPRIPAVLTAPTAGPTTPPVPRELPRPAGDFTGRTSELQTLQALLDNVASRGTTEVQVNGPGRPVTVATIDGMVGIGKSALAIQAANQLARSFPDGQLYVNLQGATPGMAPMEPLEALGRLLRTLGVDPAAVPAELEEAAARFRSLATDRRLLIVLDNAASAQQVRPLLPASLTCAVLVTSRQVLATLEGACSVHLDVLPPAQAIDLLGRIAGQARITAEPQAAAKVVDWCGKLPLAVRIVGARLAARPGWPVHLLAERLADATRRLQELETGELAVRASFDVSLHAVEEGGAPVDRAAAAAFGLLSLPDGPDFGIPAAARLLNESGPATHELLERLVDAQLLETAQPGRYHFHDLVRTYAREHAATAHPEPARRAALTRLLDFYVATAWRTLALLRPSDPRLATADPGWTQTSLPFADAAAALEWLELERSNLLSAIVQMATIAEATPAIAAERVGQLTRAMIGFFLVRGYWQDCVQANQATLELARRMQDRMTQAHAHNNLGVAYRRLGRYPEALASLKEGLTLFRKLGDQPNQANNLDNLGLVYERMGRYEEAIASLQDGLALSRASGDRWGQARNLNDLGLIYGVLGQLDEAIACLQTSLALFRTLDGRRDLALSLHDLGITYRQVGRLNEAIACLQEGLSISRELGDRWGQAHGLNNLGVAYRQAGNINKAIASLQESAAIFREFGNEHLQSEALRDLGDALIWLR